MDFKAGDDEFWHSWATASQLSGLGLGPHKRYKLISIAVLAGALMCLVQYDFLHPMPNAGSSFVVVLFLVVLFSMLLLSL